MKRGSTVGGSILALLLLAALFVGVVLAAQTMSPGSRVATKAFTSPISPLPTPTPEPSAIASPSWRATEVAITPVPPDWTDTLADVRQITTQPSPRSLLAVDGDFAVWRAFEEDGTHIVAYDFRSGEERRISSLPGGKARLRIAGGYVVWEDTAQTASGPLTVVRVYDLNADQEVDFGSPTRAQVQPDVARNLVVWCDARNGPGIWAGDIFGYDLLQGKEFPVVVGSGLHLFPRIDGNWVIYLNWAVGTEPGSGVPTLHAYNLATRENIEIGQAYYRNDAFSYTYHVISERRVIWLAADGKVKIYNLATRQTRDLPGNAQFGQLELRGVLLNTGTSLINIETGAAVNFFQPFRTDRPAHVDETATDGRMLIWSFDAANEGRIYAARLSRLP